MWLGISIIKQRRYRDLSNVSQECICLIKKNPHIQTKGRKKFYWQE